ncbi:hypothetical protein Q5752_006721 [Cryptotrichosporon argae]
MSNHIATAEIQAAANFVEGSVAGSTTYTAHDGAAPSEKHADEKDLDPAVGSLDDDAVVPDDDGEVQYGVRQMNAITQVWGKKSLVLVYACMFSLYLVNAFQSNITGNLSAYITSGFEEHSLIPVIAIVSNCVSAAAYMPTAKMLNIVDRSYAFIFMTVVATLGLILSAVTTDIYTYCAAQVFYSVGFVGLILCVDVITSDTSSLKDRGLAYAFTSSPYIITAFAGPVAAENFYDTNWRWGYGLFAIVLPVVAAPLWAVIFFNKRKAVAQGLLVHVPSGRTLTQSVWFYLVEFDILGVFLCAVGLALFLLPFSLSEEYSDSYSNPAIIAMMVVGIVTLIAFALVERYTPKPFVPFHLLWNRTVLGACFLDFFYQIAYYCWDDYFTSYLQVVYNTSIASAGYISNTFDVVNGVWLIGCGYLIRRTGYFRWQLYWSIPLFILGEGLMIYFRQPGNKLGYIIMCQVFIAIGGGTIIIVEQVAVLAAASHNDAAAMLALLGLFGYVGGAVGSAISGAIWTHVFPDALQNLLPADTVDDWEDIYNSLDEQLAYPLGDPTRIAIQDAYAIAQEKMLIAGTAIMVLALASMFVMKNINVSKIKQVDGVLF